MGFVQKKSGSGTLEKHKVQCFFGKVVTG